MANPSLPWQTVPDFVIDQFFGFEDVQILHDSLVTLYNGIGLRHNITMGDIADRHVARAVASIYYQGGFQLHGRILPGSWTIEQGVHTNVMAFNPATDGLGIILTPLMAVGAGTTAPNATDAPMFSVRPSANTPDSAEDVTQLPPFKVQWFGRWQSEFRFATYFQAAIFGSTQWTVAGEGCKFFYRLFGA